MRKDILKPNPLLQEIVNLVQAGAPTESIEAKLKALPEDLQDSGRVVISYALGIPLVVATRKPVAVNRGGIKV